MARKIEQPLNWEKMKFLENLIEAICWFWIFLSPTLVLGFAGFEIYYNYKGDVGIISFIALSLLGVISGIYFAEKVRKSVGCMMFITRVNPWSGSNKKNDSK